MVKSFFKRGVIMKKQYAFTLVELLVVLTIIAFLLAILIPALQKAREQGKEIVCRSNLKQWATMFVMYANANNNHFMPGWVTKGGLWMLALKPYYQGSRDVRLCPKAITLLSTIPGHIIGTFTAWGKYGDPGYTIPYWGEAGLYGSYGINNWVHDPPDAYVADEAKRREFWRTIIVTGGASYTIPVFGDCVWEGTASDTLDPPPLTPAVKPSGDKGGMWEFCIPRHGGAINMTFLDGSAKKVGLKQLWNLKWSRNFKTGRNIRWPDWMAKYKENY
jgi:prepilin-type N-terminal cleavage/methylation domain-containing protein/prepilin-type processing-associated H-X9-DG protein